MALVINNRVRELTSTTTFSKLASIGGETEKIGLMLLEGVDASLSPNSATAVAIDVLRDTFEIPFVGIEPYINLLNKELKD